MTVHLKQYAGRTPALYYWQCAGCASTVSRTVPINSLGSCKPECKLLMLSPLHGWIWAINHTLWLALGDVEERQYGCSRDKQNSLTGPCYWSALKSTMPLLEAPLQSMELGGHGFSITHMWLAGSLRCMNRGETKRAKEWKEQIRSLSKSTGCFSFDLKSECLVFSEWGCLGQWWKLGEVKSG